MIADKHSEILSSCKGFTLVELVLILVIAGILAVVALPRMFDRNTFDTRALGDEVKAMLRYAQKMAIAQNRHVFVNFNGNSVALCYDATCAVPVRSTSNQKVSAVCGNDATWMCIAIPSKVAIVPANTSFYFNALGRPFNAIDNDPASTFARLNFEMTGGDLTRTITVEPETGYVY